MKRIRTFCLIFGFAVIMFMPVLLQKWASRFALSGVTQTTDRPAFTVKGVLDGSFQDTLNTYCAENLPGRDLMIKVRNQAVFSLFHKSPNELIIIGKDNVLFEKEYVLKYEQYYPPVTREFTEDLCTKLTMIQEKLEARGKEMYIFISPTKVRYYEEYVPDCYRLSNRFLDELGNYEQFADTLKGYSLHVYDSIPFINERAKTADFPLYYKTGTHWSWLLSTEVTEDFIRYLNTQSRFHFPEMTSLAYPVDTPVYPDADIFDSLNLFIPPYDAPYFDVDLQTGAEAEEKPNVFCRSGSFMGQIISPLVKNGYFQRETYIENTVISRNQFTERIGFSDYSEIDLKQEIAQADIIIFEVNEAHIPVMSFSLIEYLLEHPEILDE